MRILLTIAGAILIADGIFLTIYSNFNIGIPLTMAAGLLLFLWGILFKKIMLASSCGIAKHIRKAITGVILFFIAVCVFLFCYGNTTTADLSETAVVVLGAGIRGETVTYPLKTRLDAAAEYHLQNPDAIIVVSGGMGAGETITEALAMERYLISKGVPSHKIIKEDKAESTYENLKFSKTLLDERLGNSYKALIITNDFHVFRAALIAKRLGYTASHIGTEIQLYNYPVVYIREFLAVMKTLILG